MAVPAAVGQIYQVTFRCSLFNQRVLNTFKYRLDVLPAAASTDDIADRIDARISTAANLIADWRATQPIQITLLFVDVQCLWPIRVRKKSYAKNQAGLYVDNGAINVNSAISITRRGTLATRHSVGRLQLIAPMGADTIDEGAIANAGYRSALEDLAEQMLQPIVPGTAEVLTPVLTRNPVDANYEYVTDTVVQETVRTMRRRTVGIGE